MGGIIGIIMGPMDLCISSRRQKVLPRSVTILALEKAIPTTAQKPGFECVVLGLKALAIALTTRTMFFVDSFCKGLHRDYREPSKLMILVVACTA